jgi:ATP-dependent Clp protease ATP-binding subunit ClpX
VSKTLRCSFCGKSEDQVARLVAGAQALICDECIAKAARVMQQHADEPVTPLDAKPDK